MQNIKKIYHGDRWTNSLYFHEVPLTKLFQEVRPYDKDEKHDPRKEDELVFYTTLKTREGYESYYTTITPEFRDWINKNTLYDMGLYIEIIQQRNTEDTFLVLLGYDQILGSNWLDYKNTEEIRELFKKE